MTLDHTASALEAILHDSKATVSERLQAATELRLHLSRTASFLSEKSGTSESGMHDATEDEATTEIVLPEIAEPVFIQASSSGARVVMEVGTRVPDMPTSAKERALLRRGKRSVA